MKVINGSCSRRTEVDDLFKALLHKPMAGEVLVADLGLSKVTHLLRCI